MSDDSTRSKVRANFFLLPKDQVGEGVMPSIKPGRNTSGELLDLTSVSLYPPPRTRRSGALDLECM